ncbi:MAG: hypothetical protein G01um10147_794 [Microgenomates group bacterium Gr01-1014_7]|nr:MAG: hypothetical protein G01um10147_794 [Microgenomates group bacterium Gr01-1014_7]
MDNTIISTNDNRTPTLKVKVVPSKRFKTCLKCYRSKTNKNIPLKFIKNYCLTCLYKIIDCFAKENPKPTWSRKFHSCQGCGTTSRIHHSLGYCELCYEKLPKVRKARNKLQKRFRESESYKIALLKYRNSEKYQVNKKRQAARLRANYIPRVKKACTGCGVPSLKEVCAECHYNLPEVREKRRFIWREWYKRHHPRSRSYKKEATE